MNSSPKPGCAAIFLRSFAVFVLLLLALAGWLFFDNSRLPARSVTVEVLSPLEKARLAEAQHLRRSVGDLVLPGWASADIPVVAYNEEYAFLVSWTGESAPPDGWVTVPSGERRGGAWEPVPGDSVDGRPYYRTRLPASGQTPQAFTVRIGDTYAASLTTMEYSRIGLRNQMSEDFPPVVRAIFPFRLLIGLLIKNSDVYVSLVLHESAHAYQGIAAPGRLDAGERANHNWENGYPWVDESLRAAWQTELDLLTQALRAKTDEEARTAVHSFLSGRASRRAAEGLTENQVQFERHREWVEGIGRYAELRVYDLAAAADGYEPLPAVLADPEFKGYEGYADRWAHELDQIGQMAGAEGDGRFYYSGMAQAVLLDRFNPGWQSQLMEEGVWLENLLEEAVK